MSEIREIVTKAVVAKGKKLFRINELVPLIETAEKILGCWIVNNEITTELLENKVKINGSFEINIWYATKNNETTNIARAIANYEDTIRLREIVCDTISNNTEVVTCFTQQPNCTNACINDGEVAIEILFEILAEVIGETKMMVTVFGCHETNEMFDDFENEINENFLNEDS